VQCTYCLINLPHLIYTLTFWSFSQKIKTQPVFLNLKHASSWDKTVWLKIQIIDVASYWRRESGVLQVPLEKILIGFDKASIAPSVAGDASKRDLNKVTLQRVRLKITKKFNLKHQLSRKRSIHNSKIGGRCYHFKEQVIWFHKTHYGS
jgi:hypothetical protein